MKKNKKIVIGLIAAVLVVCGVALLGQSSLFQGRLFKLPQKTVQLPKLDDSKLFLYKKQIVSAVASPVTSSVPSVVVSGVTSSGGTSRVASVVTSPVASAVISAVALDKKSTSNVNTKKLKELTESTLKSLEKEYTRINSSLLLKKAQEDYKKNPSKFSLSNTEKQTMINLYQKKNPSEFIFRK